VALLKDGRLVYMLERQNIENRDAFSIAQELRAAFEKYCAKGTQSKTPAKVG
jgi:putative YphP/YqiW family bacilliredoxin